MAVAAAGEVRRDFPRVLSGGGGGGGGAFGGPKKANFLVPPRPQPPPKWPLSTPVALFGQQSMPPWPHLGVQPPKASRGAIARTYLYMADYYKLKLSKADRRLMLGWNKMHPPTAWECKREQLISAKQGNRNEFVVAACEG